MTLYGYARVSVREPEDKDLDLQVGRLVRAGCSLGNIRAEEASGARDDRGGLLELLDLVVEGDTLVVTHIDRLSRGLTYGLQVIEGLHRAGVEFRSLSEDFDTSTATGKLQLAMVLAFSEWWRNSIRERSVAGQAKARAEGRFPGRRPSLTERQREYIRAERSKGVSQRDLPSAWRSAVGPSNRWTCRGCVEVATSAGSIAGWQPDPAPAKAVPRQSSSTGRCWPTGAYQLESASERIKLGPGLARNGRDGHRH